MQQFRGYQVTQILLQVHLRRIPNTISNDNDNDSSKSRSTVAFPSHSKKSRTHCRRASKVASGLGNHFGNRQRKRWTCSGVSTKVFPSEMASEWSRPSAPRQHQCMDSTYRPNKHNGQGTGHRCCTTSLATSKECPSMSVRHRLYQLASYQQQRLHHSTSPASRRMPP